MNGSRTNLIRVAGTLIGATVVLALLLAARPGAHGSPLPASVRVLVAPTGELEVTPPPPHPVLVGHSLRPGGRSVASTFGVRNQTGQHLAVELRAKADSSALNGLLRLRLSANGRALADTTLQGVEQNAVGLNLASGAQSSLRIEAWIPANVRSGYEGRAVTVSLQPTLRNIGGTP